MITTLRIIGILFTVILISGCSGDKENPAAQLDNIIIDDAGIINYPPDIMAQYREYNSYLLETFGIDFRVITTESEQDINSFTNEAYDDFQQESRSSSGRALVLVINTKLDETRMGVSMALEPIYTDAFVSYIERKGMVPYFRESKVSDGVYMMMELVKDRAMEADQGQEFMEPMETKTLGGGARNDALIGQVDPKAKKGQNIFAEEGDTPEDIFAKHVMGLKAHNKYRELDIFSEATRTFVQGRTVTDIEQDNEYRFVSPCNDGKTLYSDDGTRAVILHPLEQRTCCPYYFVKEQEKWRLDIFTMAKVIRFNTKMEWHFFKEDREQYNIPYEYAFGGFVYDKNGYPYYNKKKFRWGYQCSDHSFPENEPEKNRCLISWLDKEGIAGNELGLQVHDVIIGLGEEGKYHMADPGFNRVMWYFNNIPVGEQATVFVDRKEVGRVKLQAMAP